MTTTLTPRPHQVAALDALDDTFAAHARAQVRMACGTGKTLLGLWHAQRHGDRLVLVLEPSIALVAQTLRACTTATGAPLRTLAVCSDASTADGSDEIGYDGIDPYPAGREGAGVTTKPDVIARFLDGAHASTAITVVAATYHSAPAIAAALRLTDRTRRFDLLVEDEAHRLAGRTDPRFAVALRDSRIPARKRLAQTATPVFLRNLAGTDQLDDLVNGDQTARAVSMEDIGLFGPVAYDLSAGDAIGQGLLSDYRVVVAAPAREDADVPERAALGALLDTVRKHGVRRVLTFHNRVAKAQAFAAALRAAGDVDGIPIIAHAVDGSTPEAQRRKVLQGLADNGDGVITVVSSAQCLREGVDVPAVDCAVFADPRSSTVSIVQAVGRTLRTHPGKTVGTIVIPLVLPPEGDDQEELAASAFAHVWRVLRGLRAHDSRVGFQLDRARGASGSGGDPLVDLPWLEILGSDPSDIVARLLRRTSPLWEQMYGALTAAVERLGSAAAIVSTYAEGDTRLGMWVTMQRILHRDHALADDRIVRLEAVPGWRWSSEAAADDRTVATIADLARRAGSCAENAQGPSAYAGLRDGLNRRLGWRIAKLVADHHAGTLDPLTGADLDQIPGWTWEPYSATDRAGLDAMAQYIAWEHHTDVPVDHVEGDVALGRWLQSARRRKQYKVLPPAVEDALLSMAPIDHAARSSRAFSWYPNETVWDLSVEAAQAYVARVGTVAAMPIGHRETVDGIEVNIYQWLTRLRYLNHRGEVPEDRKAQVTALAGWNWQGNQAGARTVQITAAIDLGDVPHGRRGFRLGCKCTECVTETRAVATAASAESLRRRRSDWVTCHDVHAHLLALMAADTTPDRADRVITAGAIAAAAGIGIGTVKLVLSDGATLAHPLHHASLLSLTEDEVRAVRTIVRSRGRLGIGGRDPVDPGPTWALIDQLTEAGWTMPALIDRLGLGRRSTLPFTRTEMRADQARMVAVLVDSLGADVTPPAPTGTKPPKVSRRGGRAGSESDAWATELLRQGYQHQHVAGATKLSLAVVRGLDTARLAGRDRGGSS